MFCPYLKGTGKRVANPLAFGAFWQLWRVRLAWDLSFKFVKVTSFRLAVSGYRLIFLPK
jgi:hypothetical protein